MRVHSSRLIPAFDQSHQEALLGRVSTTDDDTELRVVKDVLEWELNLVTDDDGNAVADYGVEEAVGGWRVTCNVEAELRSPRPCVPC